jgi:membrane protease subunit HflC
MKASLPVLLAIAALVLLWGGLYSVGEQEQVVITRFGEPVGDPVTDSGLHFKAPFIEDVNRFEKRILQWDGPPSEMTTKDLRYIVVDSFGRWRITEPRTFFEKLRDERTAQSRLDTILGSEVRNMVARHDLIEAVRTDKARKPTPDDKSGLLQPGELPEIQFGREKLQEEIFQAARKALTEQKIGIELLDFRIKRINYKSSVVEKIYARMVSDREKIAQSYLSEGRGKALEIDGDRERQLRGIESEAYRKVQEIQGKADAEATQIYAQAYNSSPAAAEFYQLTKSLETYKSALNTDTTLILTTDSDLLRFMKKMDGGVKREPKALPPAQP